MSEFFRVGHYFDQQDAERTRTEQLGTPKARTTLSGFSHTAPRYAVVRVQL